MNTFIRTLLATLACLLSFAAFAEGPCERDPAARGLTQRMKGMSEQMDRIEWTSDREEQQRLMELHMKKMREGMRELRHRKAGDACRVEMMQAMMEQMMRYHLVALDPPGR
jgi:hypothetical protein